MGKNGRSVWIPSIVFEEVHDLMEEKKVDKRAEGFRQMAEYSKIGREMERIMRLDFRKNKRGMF
jgi:hypothetical protein